MAASSNEANLSKVRMVLLFRRDPKRHAYPRPRHQPGTLTDVTGCVTMAPSRGRTSEHSDPASRPLVPSHVTGAGQVAFLPSLRARSPAHLTRRGSCSSSIQTAVKAVYSWRRPAMWPLSISRRGQTCTRRFRARVEEKRFRLAPLRVRAKPTPLFFARVTNAR